MKKIIVSILITSSIYSCKQSTQNSEVSMTGTVNARLNESFGQEQKEVISMLDSFNIAAANADYKTYFYFFTDYAFFAGTDA
ncbi:MAG TPA: hypothetical protein VFI29_13905, partial [Hanamia sp.]|nr:hypothetical protein [Hanamia sp.]